MVVGPEQPLIDGLPDKLRQTGVKVFGPNKDSTAANIKKLITKQMRWRM